MIDFAKSRQIAFDLLSKGNLVIKLSEDEKHALEFLPTELGFQYEVLRVQTEFLNPAGIGEDISIYLVLKHDFPLSLPKTYLSKLEYSRIKYIPHVDVDGQICTFDPVTTRTNPNDPGGIVQQCLSRAIQILETGTSKSVDADFEDEFKAYWENQYDDELEIRQDILVLLDDPATIRELFFVKLSKTISTYDYIIYQDNEVGRRFINYLNYRKITYQTESICFMGELSLPKNPPLTLSNETVGQIINLLSRPQQLKFKKYIKGSDYPKFIFGFTNIGGKPFYLGWLHGKFHLNRSGYRRTTLDNYYVFKYLQKKEKLTRVSSQIFTPSQQSIRTDGSENKVKTEYKFVIAGLGSIGSNLLYFLNSINNPEFRLIDYDRLSIDNLNRHFLGLNFLGMFKVLALKSIYSLKNPFQVVTCKTESIIKTCQTDLDYLNDADFIFCAIGKANVDMRIGDALKGGIITKPTFFIWVEPFLTGGHCLYLTPGGKPYVDFFDENNFYKNNIIDNEEYLNGNKYLSMRETGCQISYTPYSLNNITVFLSAIFSKISEIIASPPMVSLGITWIGELQILEDLQIDQSEFAKTHSQKQVVVTK